MVKEIPKNYYFVVGIIGILALITVFVFMFNGKRPDSVPASAGQTQHAKEKVSLKTNAEKFISYLSAQDYPSAYNMLDNASADFENESDFRNFVQIIYGTRVWESNDAFAVSLERVDTENGSAGEKYQVSVSGNDKMEKFKFYMLKDTGKLRMDMDEIEVFRALLQAHQLDVSTSLHEEIGFKVYGDQYYGFQGFYPSFFTQVVNESPSVNPSADRTHIEYDSPDGLSKLIYLCYQPDGELSWEDQCEQTVDDLKQQGYKITYKSTNLIDRNNAGMINGYAISGISADEKYTIYIRGHMGGLLNSMTFICPMDDLPLYKTAIGKLSNDFSPVTFLDWAEGDEEY